MKLHSLTALTAAALAMLVVASCGKKGPEYGDPAVKVSPGTLTFTVDGGSNTVSLQATVAWTVENGSSWITVSPVSGNPSKESQSVTVTVARNSDIERSASVTFKAADGTLKSVLQISQDAYIPEIVKTTIADVSKVSAYIYQRYELTGTVKNLKSDGTFNLVDDSGSIIVAGLNASDMGYGKTGGKLSDVKERDTVTIVGYKADVDGKATIVYAYLSSVDAYTEPSADSAESVSFPFTATFSKGTEKFIVRNEVFPYAFDALWVNSASEGWAANAYKESQNYATESWLISPKIDMTGANKPILVFNHIVQFFTDIETAQNQTSLYVREDGGDWKKVAITFSYPDELGSETMTSEEINLSAYIGKKIQFAFKYVSDEANEAGKWQIIDFSVKENEEKAQEDNTGGTEDYNKPGWDW